MITNNQEQINTKMTSKEALENIKDMVEYITRLDYVEPIVRGEVKDALYKAYHKSTPEFEIIEKDLAKLSLLEFLEVKLGIDFISLYNALTNGVWVKNKSGQLYHTNVYLHDLVLSYYSTKNKFCFITTDNTLLLFERIKQDWALTKEDLE